MGIDAYCLNTIDISNVYIICIHVYKVKDAYDYIQDKKYTYIFLNTIRQMFTCVYACQRIMPLKCDRHCTR